MNILINYAHLRYYNSRKDNTSTGLKVGGFDRVIEYSVEDIDELQRQILSDPELDVETIYNSQNTTTYDHRRCSILL